jgi:hypothetical protein
MTFSALVGIIKNVRRWKLHWVFLSSYVTELPTETWYWRTKSRRNRMTLHKHPPLVRMRFSSCPPGQTDSLYCSDRGTVSIRHAADFTSSGTMSNTKGPSWKYNSLFPDKSNSPYGTRRSISLFTRTRQCALSWVRRRLQSTHSTSYLFQSHFDITRPSSLFPSRVLTTILYEPVKLKQWRGISAILENDN